MLGGMPCGLVLKRQVSELCICCAAGSWVARRRAAEEAARKGEQSGQPQNKKKRKRKVRYPKDFDPANPGPLPHPERWLPKWQRSDFKKKRKSRKEKQVMLCFDICTRRFIMVHWNISASRVMLM